jgi:hypothetical protein
MSVLQGAASQKIPFFILVILSGVRLSPLGTAAIAGLLYQPQIIDDCEAIGGNED